jgi:hypothetical protein
VLDGQVLSCLHKLTDLYDSLNKHLLRPVDDTVGPLADQLQQFVSFDGLGSGNGQVTLRFGIKAIFS